MLSQKKIILYIKNNQLKCSVVNIKETRIEKTSSFEFDEQSIIDTFKKIRKEFGKTVRFLVPEEKYYLTMISVPLTAKNIQSEIAVKSQELFPDKNEDLVSDWKEIAVYQKKRLIQVFAIKKKFWQNLNIAAYQSGIKLEAIEPHAFALARHMEKESQSHLLIYQNEGLLALACYQEGVLLSTSLENTKQLDEMFSFCENRFKMAIKKVYVSGSLPSDISTALMDKKIKSKKIDLDPVISLAKKTDLKNKDAKVLNLPAKIMNKKLKVISIDKETGQEDTDSKQNKNKPDIFLDEKDGKRKSPIIKKLIFILTAVFILTAGSVAMIQKSRHGINEEQKDPGAKTNLADTKNEKQINATDTDNNADKDNAVIDPKQRFNLSVQTLNGTGGPGVAKEAQQHLENLGYANVDKDNADEFNYLLTEIQIKEKYLDFAEYISNDLADKYELSLDIKTLDADSSFDLIIIIGEKNS